jgi:hypothetical protein
MRRPVHRTSALTHIFRAKSREEVRNYAEILVFEARKAIVAGTPVQDDFDRDLRSKFLPENRPENATLNDQQHPLIVQEVTNHFSKKLNI